MVAGPVMVAAAVMVAGVVPAGVAALGVAAVQVRNVVQLLHAAVEDVHVGLAVDAVHPGAGRVLPEGPVMPRAAERRRPARVARAPQAEVAEPLGVVHRVRPEVRVAVDHRAAVRQVLDGVQPAVGPADELVRAEAAGGLEVEGGRQDRAAVRVPGYVDELVGLALRRAMARAGTGEVVGAADQAGTVAAPPVVVEVRVPVALALGRLDEDEVVAGVADGVPGDRRASRVLPARDVGPGDAGGGDAAHRQGEGDAERGDEDRAQGTAR
jgi:hypothetical protein